MNFHAKCAYIPLKNHKIQAIYVKFVDVFDIEKLSPTKNLLNTLNFPPSSDFMPE